MTLLILDDSLTPLLSSAPFEAVAALEGDTVRNKEGRRTFKTRIGERNYFVKYHQGIGWKEITKELTQFRLPITSAYNEYRAIKAIQQLGIATTNPAAIGVRGLNPAYTESFLITEAIENAVTLQDVTANWPQQKPARAFKRALIQEVARIARAMHGAGINHRDFYLCHFRIDQETAQNQDSKNIKLHLMDLHRAQLRAKVPQRWLIKDLGALLFSAADIALTRTDYLRFVAHYSNRSPSQELRENQAFWQAVHRRANKFYQRDWKRPMPNAFGRQVQK